MAERGAATKGKVAKTVAGAEDVELKATIPRRQIHWGLRRYNLTRANDQERHITSSTRRIWISSMPVSSCARGASLA